MKSNPLHYIKIYLRYLIEIHRRGDAREESFYPALVACLQSLAHVSGHTNVHITLLPKSTEAGNPDFRLWDGVAHIIGYVEAKKPGEDLLRVADSEQLRRYRDTFPNLILTNFLEFAVYRNGELLCRASLGQPRALFATATTLPVPSDSEVAAFMVLLEQFLGFALPAFTAAELAIALAQRTRFLREVIAQQLAAEATRPGALTGFYEAFTQFLIGSLTPETFADLYAQTVTYGLFAARMRATDPASFNRRAAFHNIPHTVGVLRELFRFISLGDLPQALVWCIDDIAEVLAVADVTTLLAHYHTGKDDPIVHFYETFLAAYDPAERERRGVYYTPDPVVGYIVRGIHELLQTEFGYPAGLAAPEVTLLDPAAGTMTFVARAVQQAVTEFTARHGDGARAAFVRQLLPRFHAFEMMMAPYAVGHIKMSWLLTELGCPLAADARIAFYLTNTLDNLDLDQSRLPGFSALAEESRLAGEVKRQSPILVILGNPPYSGHSTNTGAWITALIEEYKQVDGKPLGEKTLKWLQDDYVKFLRFAQWKIEQSGRGIVGMITNHGYLDNPTFRGMRQSLLRTFDALYVLDLHGNTLKRETPPAGGKDENVFDIRQGVAIAFFIKSPAMPQSRRGVHHADLWGTRADKYSWLEAHERANTAWAALAPQSPLYLFSPLDKTGLTEYNDYPSISSIFSVYGAGMTTARDSFVIALDREPLIERIRAFKHSPATDVELHATFQIRPKQGWCIRKAWDLVQLLSDEEIQALTLPVLYRPFDVRWIFYHDSLVWRTVKRVMAPMLAGDNLALIVPKQHKDEFGALAATTISAHKAVAAYDINYHFPLYLYPESPAAQGELFADSPTAARRPNLHPALLPQLAAAYGRELTPAAVFYYVYGLLYTPGYRLAYAEFLRRDFPRIPFPHTLAYFERMADLGARLTTLHLLQGETTGQFMGVGDCEVTPGRATGVRYDAERNRGYINATQYFGEITPAMWQYRIGGYQVCEKWLKDRIGRRLNLADIYTYQHILSAVQETLLIQEALEQCYTEIPTWLAVTL